MDYFAYQDGEMRCEELSLAVIAREVGTPCYVYSQGALEAAFGDFRQAFAEFDPLICYAVKANSNRALIAALAAMGAGADIVSGGELARSLAAGVAAERIVFSGVGKSALEMAEALKAGILMFNVESAQELAALNQVAGELGQRAPVSLRVNPDVDAGTHPKITTGLAENKFGLDVAAAREQYAVAAAMPHLELKGISCHIGSQLTEVRPFADALERLSALIGRLRQEGINLRILDLGGGLGITYDQERPPTPAEYFAAVAPRVRELGMRLMLEPGRALVGNAGVLLTRVLYTKKTPAKNFLVVDAAMNDLVRPAFYDSYHAILPVSLAADGSQVADVVGPICETGDYLARGREVVASRPGDLLAVMSAGAYGFVMSSQYNSRPRPAEVMVKGRRWALVRRRETVDDLSRGEALAPWQG